MMPGGGAAPDSGLLMDAERTEVEITSAALCQSVVPMAEYRILQRALPPTMKQKLL